jgi:cupin 2 domain-containing protein
MPAEKKRNGKMKTHNVYAGIPGEIAEELTEVISTGKGVRIERIVSRGHASPEDFWFDQDENEWVILLKGAARLRFAGQDKSLELTPGDYIHILAHARHRVEWTDPDEETVWLAVFFN